MSINKNTHNPDEQDTPRPLVPGDETMQILLDWKRKPDWEKNTDLDLIDMDEEPDSPQDMPAKEDTLRNVKDTGSLEEDLDLDLESEEEEIEEDEEDWESVLEEEADAPEDGADSLEESEDAFEDDEDAFEDDESNTNNRNKKEKGSENLSSKKAAHTKSRMRFNLHLLLLAAIFLIAGTAVYRLYRWNQGTPIDELDTEDIDPSQFDVETLDMILPMDASLLEGREDDGVTTVLCLGNNPFSDDRSETGLASLIAQKTGSVVYDCSFPDSSVACKNATYSPDYPRDHFNLYYVIQWLRNNDFSAVTTIASQEYNPSFLEAAEVLKTVDMDKVDVIVMMYDSTDYNIGTPSDNPNNPYDVTAYTGGLRTTIETIKETWPYIRIFVMSHTYAQHLDDDGNLQNGTITDLGNGTLNHYLVKESEATMDCGVSFIDNYYGTINEDNFADYMIDYMHYNDAGREKLAERIAYIINNRMGVVNSTASGGDQ